MCIQHRKKESVGVLLSCIQGFSIVYLSKLYFFFLSQGVSILYWVRLILVRESEVVSYYNYCVQRSNSAMPKQFTPQFSVAHLPLLTTCGLKCIFVIVSHILKYCVYLICIFLYMQAPKKNYLMVSRLFLDIYTCKFIYAIKRYNRGSCEHRFFNRSSFQCCLWTLYMYVVIITLTPHIQNGLSNLLQNIHFIQLSSIHKHLVDKIWEKSKHFYCM